MNLVRHGLQLLLEIQLLRQVVPARRLGLEYGAHNALTLLVAAPLTNVFAIFP
jgi:hypothetical protein